MGTGLGAAQAGQDTAQLLKKMLTAGLTADQAFRSINSILVLRGQAGLVTLDLAEIFLDTGKARLYKWGAASSWLIHGESLERIGYATAPPGIRVSDTPSNVFSLSLKQGETLILLSDGVDIQEAILRGKLRWDLSPGDLATSILGFSRRSEDDATAAVLRLCRLPENVRT
jgi:stage II sporulation protein E